MDREPSDIHAELAKLRSDLRSELKAIRREVEMVLVFLILSFIAIFGTLRQWL
jgi:hypothetical protein